MNLYRGTVGIGEERGFLGEGAPTWEGQVLYLHLYV